VNCSILKSKKKKLKNMKFLKQRNPKRLLILAD